MKSSITSNLRPLLRGFYPIAITITVLWAMPRNASAQLYVFENIAFPGDNFTELLGINDVTVIAGYHGATLNQGFTLTLPNTFTSEKFPDSVQTQVTGINNAGEVSGFYVDAGGTNHGFLDNNGLFTTVDFPNTTFNQLLGLNNNGQAAGYFQDPNGFQHPYILQPGGTFNLLGQFIPGGASAQATDINDDGVVTGFFTVPGGLNGFLFNAGKLTTLSFPGATETMALGLNDLGQVVGSYTDAAGNVHGFLYTNGVFTALNVPGAPDTVVNGINNSGQIVGFTQQEPNGNTAVGFVAQAQSPAQAIDTAKALVQQLPLNRGQKTSLTSKLNAVTAYISQGDIPDACGTLGAEVNEMNALVRTDRLSAASAAPLLAEVQAIQSSLGCL